ncbi:pyridoxal phosphate-dependent transferase [Mycena sp. CBHHK59/15]|nr:pyridoxal phosphate-dependent transferase [Mycena sp. CBHHK59/15]
MDVEQFRKHAYQAIDRICDYYYSVEKNPLVAQVEPGYLRKLLPTSPPFHGENFDNIADDYQKFIIPGLTNWQHPSFFGYFPAACTWEGIIGDLYSGSIFNPGFNWLCSPASTELETVAMDWAAQMLGLSDEFQNSSSTSTGGGSYSASESVLVAMVAARTRYLHQHPEANTANLLVYVSSETHSVGLKTARILGIQVHILEVSTGDNFSLRGQAFCTALYQDRSAGKHPFFLLATVGTTSSGAVDNIGELGVIAQEHCVWIHIDAAWAGVALACPEFRELCQLDAINQYADSFCTNFHKWGLVNGSASAFWVRQSKYVTNALDVTPAYLSKVDQVEGNEKPMLEMRNWKIGLVSHFRALKIWFVLRSFGIEGFQRHIRHGVALNSLFVSKILHSAIFALVAPPSLALTVFRIQPSALALTGAELNTLNKLWYKHLSNRADLFITHTVIAGIYCVRFAAGAQRTSDAHVECAYKILEEEAQVSLLAWSSTRKD